jgi:hypothetical protein
MFIFMGWGPISLMSFVVLLPVNHDSAVNNVGKKCSNMHAVIQSWPTCSTRRSYLLALVT